MPLTFWIDWASTDSAVTARELRATMCSLEIWVNGECVTMSYDAASGTVRRSITVALYPVAEWIAFNWWLLTRNGRAASRHAPGAHISRHSLTAAGDGYAWPALTIVPQGELAEVRWRPHQPAATNFTFATGGQHLLPLAEVQAELSNVVDVVLGRLSRSGVDDTPLHDEWARLAALDDEEAAFCEASARLGLDPFSEGVEVADAIQDVYTRLDKTLSDDFLDAAEPARLGHELTWVASGLARIRTPRALKGAAFSVEQLTGDQLARMPSTDDLRPWAAGYTLAHAVRAALGLAPEAPLQDDVPVHVDEDDDGHRAFSGIGMHPGTDSMVNLVLPRRVRDEARRFAIGRALWHSMTEPAQPFLHAGARHGGGSGAMAAVALRLVVCSRAPHQRGNARAGRSQPSSSRPPTASEGCSRPTTHSTPKTSCRTSRTTFEPVSS